MTHCQVSQALIRRLKTLVGGLMYIHEFDLGTEPQKYGPAVKLHILKKKETALNPQITR